MITMAFLFSAQFRGGLADPVRVAAGSGLELRVIYVSGILVNAEVGISRFSSSRSKVAPNAQLLLKLLMDGNLATSSGFIFRYTH